MANRRQRTINSVAEIRGFALFSGAETTLRILPAEEGFGRAFLRTDLAGTAPVPATIGFAVDRHRRTAVANGEASVEMTEHVLAALAGLEIDNCLVEIDGPECPGLDGSALPIVEAVVDAGIVEQSAPVETFTVEETVTAESEDGLATVVAEPCDRFEIRYDLDYGNDSPIPPQSFEIEITAANFDEQLAAARTFVLESEIAALRALGYGSQTSVRDLIVFGADGPVDNTLRWPEECARHKLLDCVGDFALLGKAIRGRFHARRSGHQLNRDLVLRLVGETRDQHTRGDLDEAA